MSKIVFCSYNMSMGHDYSRLSARAVLDRLASDRSGLTPAEAKLRHEAAGSGLPEPNKFWLRYGAKIIFGDSFIVLLVIALLASRYASYGHAGWLLAAILIWQLWLHIDLILRGKRFVSHLSSSLSTSATVMRKHRQQVEADRLVPGDIVELRQGDLVPADLRLLSANNLVIDERGLPDGRPHAKKETTIGPHNIALFGTTVLSGSGSGVAIACGKHTILGSEVATPAHVIAYVGAPLQAFLQKQRKLSAQAGLVLALVLSTYALLSGATWAEFWLATATLTIALAPISLPMLRLVPHSFNKNDAGLIKAIVTGSVATKSLLAAAGIIGLFSFHVPPATTVSQLLIFDFIALLIPLAATGLGTLSHSKQHHDAAVYIGLGMFLASLAYIGFLAFFRARGISPENIDPSSHLYDSAISLSLVIAAAGQLISFLFVRLARAVYTAIGISAVVITCIMYSSYLQSFFATGPLSRGDWLIALCAVLIFILVRLLQLHTRHHTRHALLRDHASDTLRKHPKLA